MQKENQENIDILKLLGISIDDGKIELDTNKTKSFFQELQNKVESKSKEVQEGIESGKLDLSESVGLKVEDEKIELDLNKTKSLLETIAQKAQSFIEGIDKNIGEFNKKE
jgi:hypothetical protein